MDTTIDFDQVIAVPYRPGELRDRITVKDLLDRLLDIPDKDALICMSLQESKWHPLEMEGFHTLSVKGGEGVIWRSATKRSKDGPEITFWQDSNAELVRDVDYRSVRQLIYKLMALDLDQTIDLGGHFYTEFVIRSYPATPPKPELKLDSELVDQAAVDRAISVAVEDAKHAEPLRKNLFARIFGRS